jgi:Phage integrase family
VRVRARNGLPDWLPRRSGRRPRAVHSPLERERIQKRDGVFPAVVREMAVVAVDHRDARAHEAGDREHRHAGAEGKGGKVWRNQPISRYWTWQLFEGRLSTRAVPLQAKALEALDRLPASDNPMLFPNMRGGRIDFRIFGRKHWRPAQTKAGIDPIRGLYDLRHTYATFALRAGVPVFAVSRFMGTSIAMIDRHYGHLANDSREHAVALLDALALERAVDAAWTSHQRQPRPLNQRSSRPRRTRTQRVVDARWTPRLVSVASTDD